MNIPIDNYNLFTTLQSSDLLKVKEPILFIHGFAGSSDDWLQIFPQINKHYLPFAIDLIGHGKSSSPSDISYYTHDAIANHLKSIFDFYNITEPIICGYSMGGRAAISFAMKYPQNVKALILESSSPGIINSSERDLRYRNDLSLAENIQLKGLEFFDEYWSNLPIFDSQKYLSAHQLAQIKTKRLNNNITGLCNSLRGFSVGVMPNFWNRLPKIEVPVLLISGEYDNKYTEINRIMSGLIKNSESKIIDSCGHNTHLEKPMEFVSLVNLFLDKTIKV